MSVLSMWKGGHVYSFDECRRRMSETWDIEELGQLFFGLVHLENDIS